MDFKGKTVFKVVWLKLRTDPHVGNLKEDYNLFKTRALQIKENERINEWVEEKAGNTYIRFSDAYLNCPFTLKGWTKT
jgi:peptidyl-prolyl cis-trans isomerase SurA